MLEKTAHFPTSRKRKRGRDVEPPWLQFQDDEDLPADSPQKHHVIAQDVRHGLSLSEWLGDNEGDPALEVCGISVMVA